MPFSADHICLFLVFSVWQYVSSSKSFEPDKKTGVLQKERMVSFLDVNRRKLFERSCIKETVSVSIFVE